MVLIPMKPLPLLIVLLSVGWASAEIIWRGDFETGTTEQWRGAPKGENIKIVEAPVRARKFALSIAGSNAARRGDLDRIEFQHQPAGHGTAEGTERYFGWSVFLPEKLTAGLHSVGYSPSNTQNHEPSSLH